MKVLFTNSPFAGNNENVPRPSSGYLFLGSVLRGREDLPKVADVLIDDVNIRDGDQEFTNELKDMGIWPEESFADLVDDYNPDILGTTVYDFNWEEVENLFESVKENDQDILTAVGGPLATIVPRSTLKLTGADLAFRGEAEFTFRETVEQLGNRKDIEDLSGIDGLVAQKNGEILYGKESGNVPKLSEEELENLDIDYDLMGGMQMRLPYPRYDFTFSRDCPHGTCSFCFYSNSGRSYRTMSEDKTLEIVDLIDSMLFTQSLNFGDSVFGGNRERAKSLLKKMDKKDYDFNEMAGQFSVDIFLQNGDLGEREVDEELIDLLNSLSFITEIGIENLSYEGLDNFDKLRYTPEEVMDVLRKLDEGDVTCNSNLIDVGPETSPEGLVEHFQNLLEVYDDLYDSENIRFNYNPYVMPVLGTKDYQKVIEKMSSNEKYESLVKEILDEEQITELPGDDGYPYIIKKTVPFKPTVRKTLRDGSIFCAAIEDKDELGYGDMDIFSDKNAHIMYTFLMLNSLNKYSDDPELAKKIENIRPENENLREMQNIIDSGREEFDNIFGKVTNR